MTIITHSTKDNLTAFYRLSRAAWLFAAITATLFILVSSAAAQDTNTGAFQGDVSDSQSSAPLSGVAVKITSVAQGVTYDLITDSQGRFFQGLLLPGFYEITVTRTGYKPQRLLREIRVSLTGDIIPVPVSLEPEQPGATPQPIPAVADPPADVRVEINTADARRDGSYRSESLINLPIGGTTITRSFDELALLLPGVAPPPQTIGDVAGPGVGPGVGSAGQFAVNGIRSRANNFTVDGSDNNDEDIGVRRQGFVALVPQPIESVKEFQIQTLLAPAQYGRNIGAQVNAVSKAGGNEVNGSVYGFFNSNKLNARNRFDTNSGNDVSPVRTAGGQTVLLDGTPLTVRNQSGGEDTLTFGQGGGAIGGPIQSERLFYFFSGEYAKINATKEKSFAVPTIEQRGPFRTGATGISSNLITGAAIANSAFPTGINNGAIFSLFPFPNNPTGVYGANTFTQVLPASGEGLSLSARLDNYFQLGSKPASIAGRFNFTDDDKDISAVNEAIFSSVRSKIKTQNLSVFFNSEFGGSGSLSKFFNQTRFSFGRSRLQFDELRDREFLIPNLQFSDTPFLLNTRSIFNTTLSAAQPRYSRLNPVSQLPRTTEENLGPIGQVIVYGFSPIGVDVYNFPQSRINKTYQIADDLSWRAGAHALVFGVDFRRVDLDSDLPRISRPLITFSGSPRLIPRPAAGCTNGGIANFCFLPTGDPQSIIRPEDILGFGASSNYLLTFNAESDDATARFRYYQSNFFAQDTWRPVPELTLSFGLRYEYNSPVREVDNRVEATFADPRISQLSFLRRAIDGRSRLYEPDRNNFAPRLGLAYTTSLLGDSRVSVFRAGYGLYYDQILGAVANQSRNVFPNFFTINFAGSMGFVNDTLLLQNPTNLTVTAAGASGPIRQAGTLNTLNPIFTGPRLAEFALALGRTISNAVDVTLPSKRLSMPTAHQYSFSFEQQITRSITGSVAYVGTSGRNLLRFTTPNLGAAQTVLITSQNAVNAQNLTTFRGGVLEIPRPLDERNQFNEVVRSGVLNQFETTGKSTYNSVQGQLRTRFLDAFNMQLSYTFSDVDDDVSDVFDLAGAYVLPQNSLDLAAERGPANFDVRHRWAYDMIYTFGKRDSQNFFDRLANDLTISATGRYHSGQPFTVNSVVDVNLDGNLTDRPNTTVGIDVTGDRSQPLRLTTANTASLLAAFGQSGSVGRNAFRAGSVLALDLSVIKRFGFGSGRSLGVRTDVFNFIDRANYGIPVRLLEAPGFGRATGTVTPGRRVQFSIKYEF